MKFERNSPCWCGSGRKYKRCHLGRSEQAPIKEWEFYKRLKNVYTAPACLAPTGLKAACSGKIVQAHTIPKSVSLRAISRDGHVYGHALHRAPSKKKVNKWDLEIFGVNRASTFAGFCSTHDDSIFAPLEKAAFVNSEEQCFLLSYRAAAREFYTKKAQVIMGDFTAGLDRGISYQEQIEYQKDASGIDFLAKAGLEDSLRSKASYDRCLLQKDYREITGVIFEFSNALPVMCSGGLNPIHDFEGNLLQDLGDFSRAPDNLTINSFYSDDIGRVVFSWMKESDSSCERLMKTLIKKSEAEIPFYIIQYLMKNLENCFISPVWWETLPDISRKYLIELFVDNCRHDRAINALGIEEIGFEGELPTLSKIIRVN